MSPHSLSQFAKEKAAALGFTLCGVTGPLPRGQGDFYDWWVGQGYAAGMHYLKTQKPRRRDIEKLLPGAKSVVVCAMRFPGRPAERSGDGPAGDALSLGRAPPTQEDSQQKIFGKVARYAVDADYHSRLLPLLEELARALDEKAGTSGSRAYVDTGALNERGLAASAGLGWVGKNSMLISREEGSWFWLGEVLTRAELAPDSPTTDHCGKCRACLDACPTGAILDDVRAIDSRKCLSYWNIEHRGEMPDSIAAKMGDWLLGCDICQETCPWNGHSVKRGRTEVGAPEPELLDVDEILALDEAGFMTRFHGRAHQRAKLAGLQRNARIVKRNRDRADY